MGHLKKIAVVSYNDIGNWRKGMRQFPEGTAYIYPKMFTRNGEKGKEYVTKDDPLFKELIQEDRERKFDLIIVFFGKEDSGGVDMIAADIFCSPRFAGRVLFILCEHEIEEKFDRLRECGIDPDTSPMVYTFKDNVLPCRENYILVGVTVSELGG